MSDPNPGAPDAPTPPPARRWARRFAVALALVVALVAIAWLAVPPIVRSQLESRLTGTLGRPTRVETVAFNPFRLELELRKLTIAGREAGPPFVAVDGIVADLSAASIWHRAPVLDALRIVRPSIALARDAEGRWSFDDIADRLASAPPGPPPRFSLNNIEIDGGSVTFDDRAAGRRHALTALDVGIPFLSSLPYQTDVRVTPRASGVVNGARFALGGSTVPFAERREASLDIDIDALPLPEYVAYLPSKPRFTLAGGALTTRLKLVFVDGKPAERKLELRGEARVDGGKVRTGYLGDRDFPRLAMAAGRLADLPFYIDDTPALSILEMRAKARRLQREKEKDGGVGLIVVDYLQLMRAHSKTDNREQEISLISRSLKALAKELSVPVIALSQLNRAVESRADKRPMMSDLRESGAIEQDADVIAFVYRDDFYNKASPEEGTAEIIIAKQRNGPQGTVKLAFRKEFTTFENLSSRDDDEQAPQFDEAEL
ncbi:MAG: DUF748 domain-containing protein [Burkholderiales bacterium]|nr:DUF748 domain-containing protein [Burkholderiales bacterium]